MFLLERLFGIFTFSLILFFVVNLISKIQNIKSTKKILFVYLFFLFFMGYFYYPYKTADLYYTYNLINRNLIYKNSAILSSVNRFSENHALHLSTV